MRWVEFFEGDNKSLSMPRLLCFLSFSPATLVLFWLHSETALGIYLSVYVIQYGLGKATDIFMPKAKK